MTAGRLTEQVRPESAPPKGPVRYRKVRSGRSLLHAAGIKFSVQELGKEEFSDLCSLLERRLSGGGRSEAPRGRSKKADYIALACRLVDTYGEEQALVTAAGLLGQVSSLDCAEGLLRVTQTYVDQRKRELEEKEFLRKKYMEDVIEKLKLQEAEKVGFGEHFHLTERYTKLVFLKHHSQPAGRVHEIVSSGRKQREVRSPVPMFSYSSVSELFNPDKHGHTARIIGIQGAAGVGKTTLAQKIMLDWASGNLFEDRFEYVFYVQCRDIDPLPGYPVMADLLLQSYSEMPKAKLGSVVDPAKLLFLIDGFDELRHPLFPPSGDDKPLQCAQKSLLRRTLLSKSFIIITTRPTALEKLRQCVKIQRLEEIVGFSEEDRKEYFSKFFGRAELGAQAFEVIQERPAVHSICFIPVVCWIICRVLKLQMEKGEDLRNAPRTVALFFIYFLSSLTKNSAERQPAQDTLKRVCALAKNGLYENKTQFGEEDLHKHGLSILHIHSLLQSKDLFHEDAGNPNIYSFAHSIFQEFFAALFYVLGDNDEPTAHAMNPEQSLSDLLRDYMERDQNHLLLTVRFIFGFANTEAVKQMAERLEWKVSSETKSDLLSWIKKQIQDNSDYLTDYLMDLLYCLHEIQDEEFAKIALESFNEIHIGRQMDTMDMKVLLFCFKNSAAIQKLSVSQLTIEAEDVKSLIPWTQTCSSLTFWNCTLSGPGCAELRTMLSTNPTLTELSLNCLGLKDSGVRLVCEGLKRSGCRIQRLEMCNCLLTGVCCADLASVLSTTPSLTELALSDDALGDLGIAQLCEGLRQSQCKLQRLELDQTSLTGSCCADLASVLRTKTSLTELSLRHNALGDAGLRRLCEGLNHPGIRLQKLDLCHCSLTGACCADLAVALSETPSLIELNLGRNELGDSGLIQLCHGLERPDCRIEKLWLVSCSLSGSCGAALASLLATSQTLTTLCLAENELGDPAVMQLCEGLKEPGCKIQTLDLWLCSLSASCCPDLASAVIGSPALTELILSDNKLGDSGLQLLCDGLRNPGCKVQTLNLDTNGLTDDSIPDLRLHLLFHPAEEDPWNPSQHRDRRQ
ncbi:hypothetical protein NDU88_011925 [Pleurodeles waltl]|uniref:NACHT, LRR and PYD domains-containing protein 3 n=1 Tax=Pleurodeles waltl TaxID=8319 RepID=A0AAV7S543_PLEWA|nr:hypothetical protein NDU88_011925 [Pleurodeles waltl]